MIQIIKIILFSNLESLSSVIDTFYINRMTNMDITRFGKKVLKCLKFVLNL